MDEAPTLEALARRAVDGDRDAVASIVRELQANVYALALRMLWNPQDAEDATQEILVRVVTRLAQFDFKSRLRTWAYRVATNYLLDVKKSCVEREKQASSPSQRILPRASRQMVLRITSGRCSRRR
jgi:RNA polymerase sigma factor (sigma-70 family)